MEQIVVFTVDQINYALHLSSVIRVVHAVEITPLPKAPSIISGIINVQGQIIPVIDVRKRFGLPTQELKIDDQLIIANTGKRQVCLWVTSVSGTQQIEPWQKVNTKEKLNYIEYISGVAKINEELVLIYDLEQFLHLDEEIELDGALAKMDKHEY